MAKIPEPTNTIASLIDRHHESMQEPPRGHMGCSEIGHHCERWLWLKFRWAVIDKFNGRTLRMFRRGQLEERTIIEDLRAIGITIHSTEGGQSRVKFDWHVSGSIDGIIEYGVPEAPHKRHIAEFKTHNTKSFDDVEKQGVEKSKPQHYTQMQLYMLGTGIDRALYFAICKDDDRIYTERVKFDKDYAERALAKGQRLVKEDCIPPPISTNPSWYQCKWCPAYSFCHEKEPLKQVNCRTCAFSEPLMDGTWRCNKHDADDIPLDYQRVGCDDHRINPQLAHWKLLLEGDDYSVLEINGKPVKNGVGGYSSREIFANPSLCADNDDFVIELRNKFDGKITT
jgi:hypothetical protein